MSGTFLEGSEIGYLTWWNFPKKAWLLIFGELSVIVSLSISLYLTYLNDVYFQSYTNSLSPLLVPILSVTFGISSASVAAYLYIGMKRIQIERDSESPTRKKINRSTRESGDLHPDGVPASKNENQHQQTRGGLRPIVPSTGHVRSKQHPKELEDHNSTPEPKKQP